MIVDKTLRELSMLKVTVLTLQEYYELCEIKATVDPICIK